MREQLKTLTVVLRVALAADRRLTATIFGLAMANAVIWVAFFLGMRATADAVGRGDADAAVPLGILLGVLMAIWPLWWRNKASWTTTLHERTSREFDRRLIEDAIGFPTLELHEDPEYLDRLTMLRAQMRFLGHPAVVAEMIGGLLLLGISVVMLGLIHPLCALLPAFALPSIILARRVERRRVAGESEVAAAQRLRQRMFVLLTDPGSAKETKVLGLENELHERHRDGWAASLRINDRVDLTGAVLTSAGWAIFTLGLFGALWLLVWRASHGGVSAGDAMLFVLVSRTLTSRVGDVLNTFAGLQRVVSAAQHFRAVQSYARRSVAPARPVSCQAVPGRVRRGISLEGVTFIYPGQETPALSDVSLELPAGTSVALVGENGAGKSTLVKLLCRLYEPTHGTIALDERDISAFDAHEWRARLSAGFQDFARFELLLRESVGIGDLPRHDDAASVRRALDAAGGSSLELAHPRGLETQLGGRWSGGVELSGGQWQRVALARAFMRQEPLLLVLDEPTASLDVATEHQLFKRFAAAASTAATEGSITVFVSHRLSTVRTADLIVFLQDGRIAEQGTHEELMRAGGSYAELYGLQSRAYSMGPLLG